MGHGPVFRCKLFKDYKNLVFRVRGEKRVVLEWAGGLPIFTFIVASDLVLESLTSRLVFLGTLGTLAGLSTGSKTFL